jgi:uncharacterized protein with HEPN domain
VSRDVRIYILDIIAASDKVRRYTAGMTREQLLSDERTYDAVLRNLEIIGEAAKHLLPDVRQEMPSIPWTKIAGMRDILAHVYFGVDPDIVWDVVENKVPELHAVVSDYKNRHPDV